MVNQILVIAHSTRQHIQYHMVLRWKAWEERGGELRVQHGTLHGLWSSPDWSCWWLRDGCVFSLLMVPSTSLASFLFLSACTYASIRSLRVKGGSVVVGTSSTQIVWARCGRYLVNVCLGFCFGLNVMLALWNALGWRWLNKEGEYSSDPTVLG